MGATIDENRRMLAVSSVRLKHAIKIMERMDATYVDRQAIGGRLSAGKRWTDMKYYKDAVYTLKIRGEMPGEDNA